MQMPVPDEAQEGLLITMGIDHKRYGVLLSSEDYLWLKNYRTGNELVIPTVNYINCVDDNTNLQWKPSGSTVQLLSLMGIHHNQYTVQRDNDRYLQMVHHNTGRNIRIWINRRCEIDYRRKGPAPCYEGRV